MQSLCLRIQVAVLLSDGDAHLLQAFNVQIDGTAADGASAGHGHAGHSSAGNERTEHQGTGAHGLHDFVLGDGVGECAATDGGRVRGIGWPDFCAHRHQQPPLGCNVPHLGNVFESDLILGKNRRGHAGQR